MDGEGLAELVAKRTDILRVLAESSQDPRGIADEVGVSRATVGRAIDELSSAGLVSETGSEVALTPAGRAALEHHTESYQKWSDIEAATSLLSNLPLSSDINKQLLYGSQVIVAEDDAPYRPEEYLTELITTASAYRAVCATGFTPDQFRGLYDHIVNEGRPVEVVVPPKLINRVCERFAGYLDAMAQTDSFELYRGEPREYGIILATVNGEQTASLVIPGGDGSVAGVITTETASGVSYAEDLYLQSKNDAEPLDRNDIKGRVKAGSGTSALPVDESPDIEQEGFVRITDEYFERKSVLDPVVSYRGNLGMPEVAAGHAVPRRYHSGSRDRLQSSIDMSSSSAPDRNSSDQVHESLIRSLRDGQDCVVLGPPASGKSTICKQVAYQWYDDEIGAVYYREGAHATEFSSVPAFRRQLESHDGQVLVVVEDGGRSEAAETLRLAESLSNATDVVFLFDSRASEWPPSPEILHSERVRQYVHSLETVALPELTETAAGEIIDHILSVLEADIPQDAGRLLRELRTQSQAQGRRDYRMKRRGQASGPGEVARLIQSVVGRVAATDDPTQSDTMPFEANVRQLYQAVQEDGEGLLVATFVNLLNAANLDITTTHLYAMGDEIDDETIDEWVEFLEGRIIFEEPLDDSGEAPTYTAIHQEWSVTFLYQLLTISGQATARRLVGRCLSSLLRLSKLGPVCDRIVTRCQTTPRTLEQIKQQPGVWADKTLKQLFDVGRRNPGLAPLFGTSEHLLQNLPPTCSSSARLVCARKRAEMYFGSGDFDQARSEFETVIDWINPQSPTRSAPAWTDDLVLTTPDVARVASRLYDGLASVQIEQGDNQAAKESLEEASSYADESGDYFVQGSVLFTRIRLARSQGDLAAAEEYVNRARQIFDAAGDEQGLAEVQYYAALVDIRRGTFDAAASSLQSALTTYQNYGIRRRIADCFNHLGVVAKAQNNLSEAVDYHTEALHIRKVLNDRHGQADSHNNLGEVYRKRNAIEKAQRHYTQALEIYQTIGDADGAGSALNNLGLIAKDDGRLDDSKEYLNRALETAGLDTQHRAHAVHNLGIVHREQGDIEMAEDRLLQSLNELEKIGAKHNAAVTYVELGKNSLEEDSLESAQSYFEQAYETSRDCGAKTVQLDAAEHLIDVYLQRGKESKADEIGQDAIQLATDLGASDRRSSLRSLLDVQSQ